MRDGAIDSHIMLVSIDMIISPLEPPVVLALPSIKGSLLKTISMPYILDSAEELLGNNNEERQHQRRHIDALSELSVTLNLVIKAIGIVKNGPSFIVWGHLI